MTVKVGIVEDEEDIRQGFAAMLNSNPLFHCTGAYPAAEPFMADISTNEADVVIMDIQLPGISGIECIDTLKKAGVQSQFLVCSVYQDEDNIFNALRAGAVGYILKNTRPQHFFDAIMDVYQGGSPMSGEIARKVVNSFGSQKKIPDTSQLTAREKEILGFLSEGYRYKEIADKLFISIKTVRTHIRNIYEKLQVGSRMDAVNKAFGK